MSQTKVSVAAALEALIEHRPPGQIVVTNQAAARVWPQLGQHPLDLHYNPSTMGGAIPLGLGLALARPEREVLVVSGDGSLLMSLGSLVTAAAAGATNLTIVVLENGLYEVTGGQKTPAAAAAVDLAAVARACGFATAQRHCDLARWRACTRTMHSLAGPRFFTVVVERTCAELLRGPTPPIAEQVARFIAARGEC